MNIIKAPYQGIINAGESFSNLLLLVMRLFWGYSFFTTGLGKIENIQNVIDLFSKLNVPFPEYFAPIVAWIECVGGACLFFGFASRLVAIPLAIIMIVALFTADFDVSKNLFVEPQKFINLTPFNFMLASLVVFAFGPGKISIDYLLGKLFSSGK